MAFAKHRIVPSSDGPEKFVDPVYVFYVAGGPVSNKQFWRLCILSNGSGVT